MIAPRAALAVGLALAACQAPGDGRNETSFLRRTYAVPAEGFVISYLSAGDPTGRRVVFVHGTPGDAAGWTGLLKAVPTGLEFVAIDRPGFGDSRPGAAVPSLARQAAALEPLLVTRSGSAAIIVGHSLGAPIAARAAARYPDRVGGLVLVAGALDPALEKLHWAQPIGEWPPVAALLPRRLRNANRELIALEAELDRLAPELPRLRCRVEAIHGTRDELVPFANTDYLRRRLENADLKIVALSGADHFLPWSHAATILSAVRHVPADARC